MARSDLEETSHTLYSKRILWCKYLYFIMSVSKIPHKLISPEEREMTEKPKASSTAADEDVEEEKFDKNFWVEVEKKVKKGISWNKAMDEVRAERLMTKYGNQALVVLIRKWPKMKKFKQKPKANQKKPKKTQKLITSLEYLISRLTEIILDKDKDTDYAGFRFEEPEKPPKTLLHLAAEQNFLHVSRCLVDRFPTLLHATTDDDEWDKAVMPVELALEKRNDDTAAYLISQMLANRVTELFLYDDIGESVKFYFGDIISYRDPETNEYGMKKTVVAVLNKLINPYWPYQPDRALVDEDNVEIQRALDSVPDDPMNYDFHYHILETDENGRTPKYEDSEDVDPLFNHRSMSCLERIADSENKEAVKHPVVRMLVLSKWNEFAFNWFCFKAVLYLIFLAVLSYALMFGSTRDDPTQYDGPADNFRAVCEMASIIFLIVHLLDEFGEILREKISYFEVWHNYLDLLGIILTLVVLPLRYAEVKAQWSFAALGLLFNFLRLFKFSHVSRVTGLYTTTLVKIIQKDIPRFLLFFSVVFIGFCGAMYLALKVNDKQDSFGGFAWLMLAGFRALAEQQSLEDDYQKFSWLPIIILLAYMMVVIVILLNILIAQLSYTYDEAKKIAKLQYAADIMRIVSRVEYSPIRYFSLRIRNFIYADWINDEELAKEMLEYTDDRHPWETVGERLSDVREIMGKLVRKGKEKDPLETIDDKVTHLTEIMKKPEEESTEEDPLKSIDEKITRLTEILEKFPEAMK
ncbi:uncharacterized protein LOC114542467 [Dendronephthya gigantea]|uniref:uncharacterized protein LOC114542467 n=1 Tax=Dendronephthya gigantea TaxID=151771 RepID=UPI00106AAE19|nr:uncharacterized protein LOC114542467 [Dendronephthya gigantea]